MTPDAAAPRTGRRGGPVTIGVVAVILAMLVLAGYSCFKPHDRSTYSTPAQRLAAAPLGVTYLPRGALYLVALMDGGFLALDDQERSSEQRQKECVIRWRPDLEGGIFQEDTRCGGATFGRDGAAANGGLGLLRHPVRVAGKRVVVDIRQCMAPEDPMVRPCKEYRR